MKSADGMTASYCELTVILPTLNESLTVGEMIEELRAQYPKCRIVVSDDGSADGTREKVLGMDQDNLQFLDRSSEPAHGLTASVLDAIMQVRTDFFVVMDSDGQHPSGKVGEIYSCLLAGYPMVIPYRVSVEKEWGLFRKLLSGCGTWLARAALLVRGRHFLECDVLSGFFGCRTEFWRSCGTEEFKRNRFRLKGYKVLLDFLKYAPRGARPGQVPYRFNLRRAGETKINLRVHLEFLKSCLLP